MVELKTQKNNKSVLDFLNSIGDEKQRSESLQLLEIFKEETGEKAYMWGDSIIGFGSYDYFSAKGYSKCEWFYCGFSPRKGKFSLYFSSSIWGEKELLDQLGKYKSAVSCLYIKNLAEVDLDILRKLIKVGYEISPKQCKKS